MIKVSLKPYFSPTILCFQENNRSMLADQYRFQMPDPAIVKDSVLLISLKSAQMILGSQITLPEEGDNLHFTVENDVNYISIPEILVNTLGWHMKSGIYRTQCFYQFSKEPDAKFDLFSLDYLLRQDKGILKRAYFLEEVGQLCPYRLFVPTSYTPDTAWKLAVILHGLNGEDVFEKGNHKLAHMGENYNYLILAPVAYTRGMHGSYYPMARDFIDIENVDHDNPAGLTEDERNIYKLCELADMKAVQRVIDEYAIDKSNIFLGGNSMGSDGTYYLGAKYPHLFKAIAPCAGGPDFRCFPIENLKNTPIRLLCGTEDPGCHIVTAMYQTLLQRGFEAELSLVAGEPHGEAWIYDLDGMFKFFNKNSGGIFHE